VDRDAARLQSAPERRTGSVPMVAHAVVNDTAHSRRLTMEFSRFDGSHEGAWIEIRGADDLFRRLLADSTVDGNATPVYDVDLGPDAGFVEKDDNGTLWVWLQHFSTREFTVVMPLRDSTGSASAEGSGPAVTLIAAALAIAAFSRRRPG
jgi:hypothetical protein